MDPVDRPRSPDFAGVEFERYALALLTEAARAQRRALLLGSELPRAIAFADAFAPQGLFDLPGPCFVEVRLRYSDRLLEMVDRARTMIQDDPSFIIVLRDTKGPPERIAQNIVEKLPGVRVRVLGRHDLERLASQHPGAALPFARVNLQRAFESFAARSSDESQNDQYLTALRTAFTEDRLSLFVGAGVSRSAGYPDWPDLVRRLATKVFNNHSATPLSSEEHEEVQRFFEREVPASPLIVARLLRNSLGGGFADTVRGALYEGNGEARGSRLISALGALRMPQRGRLGVQAVVNYNFDDLLESELQARSIAYRVVLGEGDKPLRTELPVYHVHGFLPRKGQLSPLQKSALVLSEDAYHAQFADPFIWTNLTQLSLLRQSVCLFVGVSMTDPNHRRLLEITATKDASVRHYTIMRDHWASSSATKLGPRAQELARVFKGLEEASLSSLGISAIWVRSYDEIPMLLARLRS
ncbi:MAG: SIR2 family protein [Gemmatimonadaceae bacterium]|nr:SIR2 family protein [Gemmatimonadaceae bacterium]